MAKVKQSGKSKTAKPKAKVKLSKGANAKKVAKAKVISSKGTKAKSKTAVSKAQAKPKKTVTKGNDKKVKKTAVAAGNSSSSSSSSSSSGSANANAGAARSFNVDSKVPNASNYTLDSTYKCKLNQTNIDGDSNNNKYYIIQLLKQNSNNQYFTWNRWGRVGDNPDRNTKLSPFGNNYEAAVKDFIKKFKDKTSNNFENVINGTFNKVKGKYGLVDTDESGAQVDIHQIVKPEPTH